MKSAECLELMKHSAPRGREWKSSWIHNEELELDENPIMYGDSKIGKPYIYRATTRREGEIRRDYAVKVYVNVSENIKVVSSYRL